MCIRDRVNKYSYIATTYGFTFYGIIPATLFSYLFFFIDPMFPSTKEFLLFGSSGIIVMISAWAFTAAYHIAGRYSSIISPFIFFQILYAIFNFSRIVLLNKLINTSI